MKTVKNCQWFWTSWSHFPLIKGIYSSSLNEHEFSLGFTPWCTCRLTHLIKKIVDFTILLLSPLLIYALCQVGWNWSWSEEDDFIILLMNFYYFIIISLWNKLKFPYIAYLIPGESSWNRQWIQNQVTLRRPVTRAKSMAIF